MLVNYGKDFHSTQSFLHFCHNKNETLKTFQATIQILTLPQIVPHKETTKKNQSPQPKKNFSSPFFSLLVSILNMNVLSQLSENKYNTQTIVHTILGIPENGSQNSRDINFIFDR